MEQVKIGFRTFDVTWETVNAPISGRIATRKDKRYECYHFNDIGEYKAFVDKMKSLDKHGIIVPKIIAKSKKNLTVIRERFDQDDCLTLLSKGDIDEKIIEKLFEMYRNARLFKFDLDYMPENYVYDGKRLYYLSDVMNQKSERYSLENYGLFYWLNSKEGCGHLKDANLNYPNNHMSDGEAKKAVVLLVVKYW